jgi:GNAT superfamily N-acetyltransferase
LLIVLSDDILLACMVWSISASAYMIWQEVAHYGDIPLAPDWSMYRAMEDSGALRCYTARLHGELIGYAVFFVRQNMHYSFSKQAVQDVLFVDKHYRRGTVGTRLIRYADAMLQGESVQVVYHHVKNKPELDFGPLLKRLGYEPIDTIWGKRLDREA